MTIAICCDRFASETNSAFSSHKLAEVMTIILVFDVDTFTKVKDSKSSFLRAKSIDLK